MRRKLRIGLVLCPAAAVLLSGCAGLLVGGGAAGAGAGTVVYVQGDLEATVEHPRSDVIEASRRAIMGIGLIIQAENETGDDCTFDCVRVDGKDVSVKVRELTPSLSRVFIRVGTFGDEAYSRKLMERIQESLG